MIILKKLLLSLSAVFIFAGLTYTYSTLTRTGAFEVPVTPVTPTSSSGQSTGGVKANAIGYAYQLDFNAFGNPLKGMVKYTDTTGVEFKGKVDQCYYQLGNQAVFGGTVVSGNTTDQYFLVQVQDNGEGKKSSPDLVGVTLSSTVPTCTLNSNQLNAYVTKGNVQVHAQ